MPLRLRLELYTIEGYLFPLDPHPQDRPRSNYLAFTVIIIAKQRPVELAIERHKTTRGVETPVLKLRACFNWLIQILVPERVIDDRVLQPGMP